VAEARIAKARDAAMANVAGIAADAAGAIVGKLTGRAATAAELSAARG
jgi:F-type H+-transporting ATPase subunit b